MKRISLIVLTYLFVMLSFPVESQAKTHALSTNDWHDACTRLDMNWVNFCNGYIQAIVDSYSSTEICLESSATRAKLVTLTDDFLTKNPEYKIGGAFGQIRQILKLAYPCK